MQRGSIVAELIRELPSQSISFADNLAKSHTQFDSFKSRRSVNVFFSPAELELSVRLKCDFFPEFFNETLPWKQKCYINNCQSYKWHHTNFCNCNLNHFCLKTIPIRWLHRFRALKFIHLHIQLIRWFDSDLCVKRERQTTSNRILPQAQK